MVEPRHQDKSITPFVPSDSNIPEITLQSVGLGIILGILLTAANAYLGLYIGLTVSASIPAAIISMAILRGLLRRGTILENNIVQTISASGASLASGILFTVPALLIAGVWKDIAFWPTCIICLTGGLLGICFMIPLRKSYIVEHQDLKYPEGVACAEVLKAGDAGGLSAKWIVIAMAMGGGIKGLTRIVDLFRDKLEWAWSGARSTWFFGFETSPALLGIGYIVGLNVSVVIFLGASIVTYIAIPWYGWRHGIQGDSIEWFWGAWNHMRYLGVGAMTAGGLWSLWLMRIEVIQGVKVATAKKSNEDEKLIPRTERNMKRHHAFALVGISVVLVFFLYYHLIGAITISAIATICMVAMSFMFVSVSSYLAGLLGMSNSPISGITLCALLATGGVLLLFKISGEPGIIAVLGVSGVVCCAASAAGDLSQDLKTGYLLGATPKAQQWMEVVGVLIPAFLMGPILVALHHAYGIGTGQPGALAAPQANLFAGLARGLMGEGVLPWHVIEAGFGVGCLAILVDAALKSRNAKFRLPVMALAVGMYLPILLSTTMLIGGAIAPRSKTKSDSDVGILFASGLVAGDAIMGVIAGLLIYATHHGIPVHLPDAVSQTTVMSVAVVVLLAGIMVTLSRKR